MEIYTRQIIRCRQNGKGEPSQALFQTGVVAIGMAAVFDLDLARMARYPPAIAISATTTATASTLLDEAEAGAGAITRESPDALA